jgi:hypothetical protein
VRAVSSYERSSRASGTIKSLKNNLRQSGRRDKPKGRKIKAAMRRKSLIKHLNFNGKEPYKVESVRFVFS